LSLAGVVVGAYLVADLLAGVVHFVGDSFGTVETPLLGPTFVLPFRSHHLNPEQICQHDFVATNGNNAFATIFVMAPVFLLCPVREHSVYTLVRLFVWALSLSLLFTNQIHKWAHVADPPATVRRLQRLGVLLSPERHAVHHRPPHVGGYCVTSGLCNRVLDPIGFFPLLERVIRAALFLPKIKT
jgi:ubiquitin-conjugating enzyme E2 variant